MDEQLLKKTAALSVLFVIFSVLLLELFSTKSLKAQTGDELAQEVSVDVVNGSKKDDLLSMYSDFLEVPLPEGVSEKDIKIDCNLFQHTCTLSVQLSDDEKINENSIVYNAVGITNYTYTTENKTFSLTVQLDNVYETLSEFTNGKLYLHFAKPRDLYSTIIVVDAGHGGEDVGAMNGSVYEKDINLSVVTKLKKLLAKEDVKVYYTRTTDTWPSLADRVQLANELQADFFISVHCNSNDSSAVKGTEILYSESAPDSEFKSKWLAGIFRDEVSKALGTDDRGLIEGDYVYIIRKSQVPVALIELAYLSNDSDFTLLNSEEGQDKAAQGIYNGIMNVLKDENKQ